MKKITLTIGLIATILSTKAQDTTCTMFHKKEVLEFNYYTDEITSKDLHVSKYYDINVNYGDVLCLHLYDQKNRTRKVIITFFDGSTSEEVLESKSNVYYSPQGATKVSVGKPRFFSKL
tara:strand:+ start:929 stop:1285 length:357 start_codon:yes stop_codon:yes gene_type:complete